MVPLLQFFPTLRISITKEEIDNAGKLTRPNPRVPIIRKDGERKPVLAALVKILEINHNLPGGT